MNKIYFDDALQTTPLTAGPARNQKPSGPLLKLDDAAKKRLKILFLAKWAQGDGSPDSVDGSHAVYHVEIRDTLRQLGYHVEASNTWQRVFDRPDYDYLFTLFNRAGFLNSEMLAPLLALYHRVPHFGASPILRGLGDDKHLMKLAARARGLATPDWTIFRRGALAIDPPMFDWDKLVVKPNASSASWGIRLHDNWPDALQHIMEVFDEGHDVIVERFVQGVEIAVPIIGSNGPWFLPPMMYHIGDEGGIRSYQQKRHLDKSMPEVRYEPVRQQALLQRCIWAGEQLLPELWPFDMGRVELKYDAATDQLHFIEINLNSNIWSKKTTAISAGVIGVSHAQMLETMLCHSLRRQGVVDAASVIEIPIAGDY